VIVYTSKFDTPTRTSVENLIKWCDREHDITLDFIDALDLVQSTRGTLRYEDFAEYVVDAINDNAPIGIWYTLTADFNVNMEHTNG
jgi:hypothetical protein